MTPEGKVKNRIKKILKDLNIYYVMPVTGGYGNSGAPDFLTCVSGRFVGIEAKANGGEPTALQLYNLCEIRDSGGLGFVIDENNVETLRKTLENLL
jgi:pantoate kinase